MYRVTVLYENEPDEQEYAAHAELCRCVPNSVFRHGKVTGSPMGDAWSNTKPYCARSFDWSNAFAPRNPGSSSPIRRTVSE